MRNNSLTPIFVFLMTMFTANNSYSQTTPSIICLTSVEDETLSSYMPHEFSLNDVIGNVSEYNWSFILKNKENYFIDVSHSSSSNFIISAVDFPENLFVNPNGELEGLIKCDCVIDGRFHNINPLPISLDLKPSIISIENISKTNNKDNQRTFQFECDVNYLGTDEIIIEVEEEYNTSVRSYNFRTPIPTHVKTGNISLLYHSWITFLAMNKFGTVSKTLEFEPETGTNSLDKFENTEFEDAFIYSLDGILILHGPKTNLDIKQLPSGIYIMKSIYQSRNAQTSKLIIR